MDLHKQSLQYVNTLPFRRITLISHIAVWTGILPAELPSSIACLTSSSEINITLSDSGWLSCSYAARRVLLWLPVERRSDSLRSLANHGRRVVIGANSGAVTALELLLESA
jgi:hypothetical protein